MENIQANRALEHATRFEGRPVFLHLEVNPGAYWRNGSAVLNKMHLKGDGPYRAFLELANHSDARQGSNGLIQVNDLTHMELSRESLILSGYDDRGRIAQTVEVSLSPFPV